MDAFVGNEGNQFASLASLHPLRIYLTSLPKFVQPNYLLFKKKRKKEISKLKIENEYVSFTDEVHRSTIANWFNELANILTSIKKRMQKHSRRYTRERKEAERKIWCFRVGYMQRGEREREERKWKMERNFSLSATVLRGRRSRNEEV